MVPHGQFQDAVPELFDCLVFVREGVVPHGVQVLFDHRSFVFGLFTRVWQKVAVGNADGKCRDNKAPIKIP